MENTTDIKYCRSCDTDKALSEFYVDAKAGDGYRYQCKTCQKAQSKKSNCRLYGADGTHKEKKKVWNKRSYEIIRTRQEQAFLNREFESMPTLPRQTARAAKALSDE
jgi:hypothetical protein